MVLWKIIAFYCVVKCFIHKILYDVPYVHNVVVVKQQEPDVVPEVPSGAQLLSDLRQNVDDHAPLDHALVELVEVLIMNET